jgi:TIR domain/WD domain, G-beta repeat
MAADLTARGSIFISYSRKDMEFANRLEAGLKARNFEVLIDRNSIYALEPWRKRIETLIVQSDTVVFVLSPDAVTSKECENEVALLTASKDTTARLWDVETGAVVHELRGHAASVARATFSPDGRRVVTASWDQTARVWDIFPDDQELISRARKVIPRCLTGDQRNAAYLDPEPPVWCVDMEKWPYQTQDWKDWLRFKRANTNPPLPNTPEWQPWVAAHQ